MKVKLNIDPNQKETEIVINASELTPEIEQLYHALQKQTPNL
ncbi:MAG: LytTR family transcriptional regulator, partial [Lactobacillus sp.]|nr:LytTR family transcriptional regulator [Lactobacillus sp.]